MSDRRFADRDPWLFDLDGTLVDTAPDLHRALDATLLAHGHASTEERMMREWVGAGAAVMIRRALAAQDVIPDEDRARLLLADFLDHYRGHIADHSRVYPGIRETLDLLAARGVAMACVTNKFEALARQLLEALDLAPLFGAVIGGDSLEVRKPDPAPLLEACRQLGRSPQRALMVGDSRTDVDAARNAGIPVVCVRYGYSQGEAVEDLAADALVESVRDLL